jgi:hypothetical protein
MLKKVGKKTREWQRAQKELIKQAEAAGWITTENGTVEGNCKDCHHWHHLTPDHVIKRSRGGGHESSNIEWVCNEPPCWCHNKRDNEGDPMGKKPKSKKPKWQTEHKCKHCKVPVATYLCTNCQKPSV